MEPRARALCPGMKLSRVVAALGKNTKGFEVRQEIYGMSDWFVDGATAEFCVTQPQSIAPKPVSQTHEAAATVPIGALTAWQGLFERAKMQPGRAGADTRRSGRGRFVCRAVSGACMVRM